VFAEDLLGQLTDWLDQLGVLASLLKRRCWENLACCLALAESEPDVLKQTVTSLSCQTAHGSGLCTREWNVWV
jgi:hypothetical protein